MTQQSTHALPIKGGRVWIDSSRWREIAPIVISNASGLLRDDNSKPALTMNETEIANKDSELIACEVECRRAGVDGMFVDLEIPGLPS